VTRSGVNVTIRARTRPISPCVTERPKVSSAATGNFGLAGERIRLDNERPWQRELEMMRRQGFDLHFCSVCSREGPWQGWADGWLCEDCEAAISE
jgi:hypothetical protein